MSRGDRTVAPGNISHSMRENYQKGVSEYYKKVGSAYRNPHFPGIRRCLFQWLNNGEVTLVFQEWWKLGRALHGSGTTEVSDRVTSPPKKVQCIPPPISPELPQPKIIAADPFTSAAYHDRTSLPCFSLSFKDISEGSVPPLCLDRSSSESSPPPYPIIELVICSFALHLVSTPSELFSLLWELSLKARWLVVVAPHKKPEIKEGWGWCKWSIETWKPCQMTDNTRDILNDRVHCRIYRSLNAE